LAIQAYSKYISVILSYFGNDQVKPVVTLYLYFGGFFEWGHRRFGELPAAQTVIETKNPTLVGVFVWL
jgi:hypothetical protein